MLSQYISFGSGFWPMMRPELVNYLLESLIENEFPFIFSYASPFEQMPKDFIEKMNAREESCMVKFAPQWAVLDHPATGYYLVSLRIGSASLLIERRAIVVVTVVAR